MTLALEISLPFGRYHATPWGCHVNEGQVEWPPSPWRIVRALVSAWHTHAHDLPEDQVVAALEALCSPPEYLLPRWSRSHTRHWMPDRDDAPSLALDAFVATAPGATAVALWDVETDAEQVAILGRLAAGVAYLGRAESLVDLRFRDDAPEFDGLTRWSPGSSPDVDREALRLLVPKRPLELHAIHTRTASLQRQGRTVPPATRWATYVPPREETARRPTHRPQPRQPQVVQFSVSGRARPLLTQAALVAGQMRAVATTARPDDRSLHGHDGRSKRLDQHQHAHYLALNDLGSGRRIDRILLWVPEGMEPDTAARISALGTMRLDDEDGYLAKRLGTGFLPLGLELVGSQELLSPRLIGPAKVWRTLTPVTTNRHRKPLKESPGQFLDSAVRRALAFRGFPSTTEVVSVDVAIDDEYPANLRTRRFHRSRQWQQQASGEQAGCHVRLKFREPITGPLVLGSLAHFGLGLFVVDE